MVLLLWFCTGCHDIFNAPVFLQSFYNLFVLMTRTNWPVGACASTLWFGSCHLPRLVSAHLYAVMLPYYAVSQWSGMFFAVFLLFTQACCGCRDAAL